MHGYSTRDKKTTIANYLGFRRNIVHSYLSIYGVNPKRSCPIIPLYDNKIIQDCIRHDGIRYLIVKSTGKPICVHCGGRTKYFCFECNTGLHADYFFEYHCKQ